MAHGSSPWGVIHYDLPRRIDDYVHRSGRTGRFGREGLAIGFANGAAKGISGDLVKNLLEAGTGRNHHHGCSVPRSQQNHPGE